MPKPSLSRFLLVAPLVVAGLCAQDADGGRVAFDRAAAEHLLNRAGFGGDPAAIEAMVDRGLEASVEELVGGAEAAARAYEPYPAIDERARLRDAIAESKRTLTDDERRGLRGAADRADGARLLSYREVWFDRMASDRTAVLEKAALFWHGHFTSEQRDVRSSVAMIRQNETLRRLAFGSFRDLLFAIAEDPAMASYLDGDQNRKRVANENFAREVMELFVLGIGAYDETDVTELARALTGRTVVDGVFRFEPRQHDFGRKTILGRTGRFDGVAALDLVLEHPAATRHVARSLLRFYADPEPRDDVVDRYARKLRDEAWRVGPTLRALFVDPWFYAPERRGRRVVGPAEFVVATARRASATPPPGRVLASAADAAGQALFAPPNVKGWEGDLAWLSTGSLLKRDAYVRALVEGFDLRRDGALLRPSPAVSLGAPAAPFDPKSYGGFSIEVPSTADAPAFAFDLSDRLLGAPLSDASIEALRTYVLGRAKELANRDPSVRSKAARAIARFVLSLPEAHLS